MCLNTASQKAIARVNTEITRLLFNELTDSPLLYTHNKN